MNKEPSEFSSDTFHFKEELRVMYVAITRAQEKLIVTVPSHRLKSWHGGGEENKPSPFLPHLGKEVKFSVQRSLADLLSEI